MQPLTGAQLSGNVAAVTLSAWYPSEMVEWRRNAEESSLCAHLSFDQE